MNHTTRIISLATALVATTALTGCLRGGASTADPAALAEAFLSARAEANTMLMENTTLPDTGGGTYSGTALGMIKQSSNSEQVGTHWAGDASFEVAFATNDATFDGSITGIIARADTDQRDAYTLYYNGTQEEITEYLEGFDSTTGSIQITNGRLSPQSFNANYVSSEISGGFNHNGSDYQFGGTGRGYFFGSNADGLNVNAETNDGLTITENGTTRAGDFGATTIRE
ncbi:MAG: hypothetical protein VX874_14450 [Pseudomonadota bacterium]|nr:hypothetical protein [Pseudomonadota bacterium]